MALLQVNDIAQPYYRLNGRGFIYHNDARGCLAMCFRIVVCRYLSCFPFLKCFVEFLLGICYCNISDHHHVGDVWTEVRIKICLAIVDADGFHGCFGHHLSIRVLKTV